MKHESIAIMGCGSGGSYLYRLLKKHRPQARVQLYDQAHHNPCGISGCAWGVSRPLFSTMCAEIGVNAENYFMGKYDHIVVNNQRLKADLVIFDKPRFLKDLLAGAEVVNGSERPDPTSFDRVIDATGHARAFLPAISATPVVSAVQLRLKARAPAAPTAHLNPRGGYSWIFPIGRDEIHAGSLSPLGYEAAKAGLHLLYPDISRSKAVCSCQGLIRCHGPITPFVEGKTWGIGESIGLVDPVTGAGIIPAMVSAKLLIEHWNSAPAYQAAVLHRYSYMSKEAHALNQLMAGKPLSSSDLFFPKQAMETIGVKASVLELTALALKAARDFLTSSGKT